MKRVMASFYPAVVGTLILGALSWRPAAAGDAFDTFQEVKRVALDTSLPPDQRAARLVEYLVKEVTSPSTPARADAAGGPITSDYVQMWILLDFGYHRAPGVLDGIAAASPADPSPPVADALALARGEAGDTTVAPALIRILESHSSGRMRRVAAEALGDLGDSAAVPALVRSLGDPYSVESWEGPAPVATQWPVRQAAAGALKRLGVDVKRTGTDTWEVVGGLEATAQTPHSVAPALETFEAVKQVALDPSIGMEEKLGRLIAFLEREVATPSPPSGEEAQGGPMTSDYIQQWILLDIGYDREPGMVEAIRKLSPPDPNPALRDLLTLALGEAGDATVTEELLRIARTNPSGRLRLVAVYVLGHIGDPVAIPALKEALGDPYSFEIWEGPLRAVRPVEYPVRRAAAFILNKLGVRVLETAPNTWQIEPEDARSLGEPAPSTAEATWLQRAPLAGLSFWMLACVAVVGIRWRRATIRRAQ